jgi:hypothetical protein
MSCLASIGKLFIVGLVAAALFVVGVLVLAAFQAANQGSPAHQEVAQPAVGGSQGQAMTHVQTPEPMPSPPPPPPSLEQRIASAQEALQNLKLGAKETLESAVASQDPDAALRQVTVSLETIADGSSGANALAKQLSEEMTEIRGKMQSVKNNAYLSKNDKNDLLKTLMTQEAAVQKALGQAQLFCGDLRSIQTKEIPSWTSAYSHFVTVLGASEALKKIAPRIKASANKLGSAQ